HSRQSPARRPTPATRAPPRGPRGRTSTPASPVSCPTTGPSFPISSLVAFAGVRPAGLHATEMVADGGANRIGVAQRTRVLRLPAGMKPAVRCYLATLILPVGLVVSYCRPGHQPGSGRAHRQALFGVGLDGLVLGLGGGRPAAVPHRLPIQI